MSKPTYADFQLAMEWADAMQYEKPYRVAAILGYAHGLAAAEGRVAELESELKLWKPLTAEEAQRAYDEAPEVPLSKERIDEIVEYATRPRGER